MQTVCLQGAHRCVSCGRRTSTERRHSTLHADHAAIASLLVPTPTHALVATLRTVLDEHDPLEEGPDGLYERCDRAATGAGVAAVIARMESIPPVRASQHLDEPRVHEHIARMLAARQRGT